MNKMRNFKLNKRQNLITQWVLFAISSSLFLIGSLTEQSDIMSPIAFGIFSLEILAWLNNRYNYMFTYVVILSLIMSICVYALLHKAFSSGSVNITYNDVSTFGLISGILIYTSLITYILISKFGYKQKFWLSVGWGIILFTIGLLSSVIIGLPFIMLSFVQNDEVNIALTLIITLALSFNTSPKIFSRYEK